MLAILTTKPHTLFQVIMTSSPFLEVKVNRWCWEKKELIIEDCDLTTFSILVDYFYGIDIPESVIFEDMEIYRKLLEMADRWLMDDLKASVEELFIKHILKSLPFHNLEGSNLLIACGALDNKVKKEPLDKKVKKERFLITPFFFGAFYGSLFLGGVLFGVKPVAFVFGALCGALFTFWFASLQ